MSYYYKKMFRSCQSNISSSLIRQKSYLSFVISPYSRGDDNIPLLPLERINCVDHNILMKHLQFLRPLCQLSLTLPHYSLSLGHIRRNDSQTDSILDQTSDDECYEDGLLFVYFWFVEILLSAVFYVEKNDVSMGETL